MKKKILFLSSLPPPYYGASVMSEICFDILKNSPKFEVRSIKINYSEKISDVGKINFKKIKGIFQVRNRIKENLEDFRPDLVYFAPATDNLGLIRDHLFIKQIRKTNIPIIFHIHSRMFNKKWNNYLYKKIFDNGKAIVLGKELIFDINRFVDKENLFVLPNAIKNEVSDKEFRKIVKDRKKREFFNILFLSNMDESKGWFKLLQACKILKDKKILFNCNFVGAWPSDKEKNKFLEYVRLNGLEKQAIYLGQKRGNEKEKIIKNSDVLVFPTEYRLETFGVVIIEAMMFGLPVIANSIATIPSIIVDQKTGFLLKKNNAEEIAQSLEHLIKNKPKRLSMGEYSRKVFLKKFEINNYKKGLLKILEKA